MIRATIPWLCVHILGECRHENMKLSTDIDVASDEIINFDACVVYVRECFYVSSVRGFDQNKKNQQQHSVLSLAQ